MKVKAKRNLKEKKPKRQRNILPKWTKNGKSERKQKHLKDYEKSIQNTSNALQKHLKNYEKSIQNTQIKNTFRNNSFFIKVFFNYSDNLTAQSTTANNNA